MNFTNKKLNHKILTIIFVLFFVFCFSKTAFAADPNVKLPLIYDAIKMVFAWGLGVIGLLAGVFFAVGAIRYSTALDSSSTKNDAKNQMIAAIIGLLIIFVAVLILQTINPTITSLQIEGIAGTSGIYYYNGNTADNKAAPMENRDSTGVVSQGYTKLTYICVGSNASANNAPLLLWIYPLKDFGSNAPNFSDVTPVTIYCGKTKNIDGGKSFKMAYEYPGVYFFNGPDCTGYMSENFTADQSPLPYPFYQAVKSVKIIDGNDYLPSDSYNNYGIIFHENRDPNKTGLCLPPIILYRKVIYPKANYTNGADPDPQIDNCTNLDTSIVPGSATIFNGNVGGNTISADKLTRSGVTLFSKPWGWDSGAFDATTILLVPSIDTSTGTGRTYSGDIGRQILPNSNDAKFTVHSPGESPEEKAYCPDFASCPGSIQNSGRNIIVLATTSTFYDSDPKLLDTTSTCQIFNSKNINSVKELEFTGLKNKIGSITFFPLK